MQRMITYIFINENIEEFKLKTMNFETRGCEISS